MLADDLDAAEDHLAAALAADPTGLASRAMAVNVVVQRGRVGVRDDRDFPADALRTASVDALELRERLTRMRPFGESARMLMLAADAWAILGDPMRARPLLTNAGDEEVASRHGAEVLGDCALRCGHSDLALRFVEGRHSEAADRIRATARADLLPFPEEALAELEEIAVAGGPEAVMAAAARLGACMPPLNAPFSDLAAKVLYDSQHARMATGIQVLTLARSGQHEAAEELLDDLPDTTWTAELRLRAAGEPGAHSVMIAAADGLLAHAPDPAGRLLAARALVHTNQEPRAATELLTVARQASAPPALRSDAYARLVRLDADNDRWTTAGALYAEWVTWAARNGAQSDGRISSWQVRIAHHGGYTTVLL